MHALAIQICTVAGRVVNVPLAAQVVNFGCPHIAAVSLLGGCVSDLRLGGLEAVDGSCPTDLHVVPCRREKVVVASAIDHEGVTAPGITDWVRVCGRYGENSP